MIIEMAATARLSPPCVRLVIATPSGSLMSLRCTDSFKPRADISAVRNSGRSLGRQVMSISFIRCVTIPPSIFTPGATSPPTKWIGTFMWIFSVALMRCRSTCITMGLYGCM